MKYIFGLKIRRLRVEGGGIGSTNSVCVYIVEVILTLGVPRMPRVHAPFTISPALL